MAVVIRKLRKVKKMARTQKPKAGRVVRLTPDLESLVAKEQERGETVPQVLKRLLGLRGPTCYVLPSDVFASRAEARGAAVFKAVRAKQKSSPEIPIAVVMAPRG